MGVLLSALEWNYVISLPLPMTLVILDTIMSLIIWIVAGLILAAIYKPKQVLVAQQ